MPALKLKRNKKIQYLLFCNKGSIVSTLIALGVITTSSIGLFQYMSGFQSNVANIEQAGGQPILMDTILNNMKSLLVEKNIDQNGNSDARNIYGICSLLEPIDGDRNNDEIRISFSNISNDLKNWGKNRWHVFFPKSEWEFVNSIYCQNIMKESSPKPDAGSFKKCVKKIQNEDNAATVYAIVEIVPQDMENQNEPVVLNDPGTGSYDPSSVIFRLKTKMAYKHPGNAISKNGNNNTDTTENSKTYLVSYREAILWANDVGKCHVITTNGDHRIVQFSGAGTGTTSNKYIINNSLTGAQKNCTLKKDIITSTNLNKDITQAGTLSGDISSIISLSAGASCTTKIFRCKGDHFDKSHFDNFTFSFGIHNNSGGKKPITDLKMTIVKRTPPGASNQSPTEFDGIPNHQLDGASVSFYHSSEPNMDFNTQPLEEKKLPEGYGTLSVEAEDNPSDPNFPNAVSRLCSDICNNKQEWYPYLDINVVKELKECPYTTNWSQSEANRIRCTVCHMKACHRRGVGTFGPLYHEANIASRSNDNDRFINGLPDEPLDAQIPECKARNKDYEHNNHFPSSSQLPTTPVKKDNCHGIVLKSVSELGKFSTHQYEVAPCSEEKPILCFINGHYLPAVKASKGNQTLTPVKTTFNNAANVCYEMGRELGNALQMYEVLSNTYLLWEPNNAPQKTLSTVQSLPGVKGFLAPTQANVPSIKDIQYELVNNATRGIFFTPPAYDIANYNRNSIKTIAAAALGEDMWVGMELDAGGFIVSTPPSAMVAKNEPFALFFNKDPSVLHRLTILEDKNNPAADSEYLALGYNIRWKGLIPTNSSELLRFVCTNQRRDKFHLISETGTPEEGHEKCRDRGYIFAPPVSALDWAKMMLELVPDQQNDPHYSFPKLVDQDTGQALDLNTLPSNNYIFSKKIKLEKAWVALHDPNKKWKDSGSGIAKELRLVLSPDTDGLFKKGTDDTIKNQIKNYKGVIKITQEKGLKLPQHTNLQTIPKQKIYQICLDANTQLPNEIKPIKQPCNSLLHNRHFKPTSYTFMSHLIEQIMKSIVIGDYFLVVDPETFQI